MKQSNNQSKELGCEYCSGENDKPGWKGGFSDDGYIGYTQCFSCNEDGQRDEAMNSTKGDNTPTNTQESELRVKVINAVCFKPNIVGHIEQFEAIEALISQAVNKALDKLHYDIMDGKFRPPEGTTDPAFFYAQFHRIIDDNKLETPNQVEKGK